MVTPHAWSRRAWLAAGSSGALQACLSGTAAAALAGCAIAEPEAAAPLPLPAGPPGGRGATPMLTPWMSLTGGWRSTAPPLPGARDPGRAPLTALPARVTWQLPVGVAAQGDHVWVLDSGWRQLFRLERGRDQITPLGAYGAPVSADHALSMQVMPDGGVWLAEPVARRVVLLDWAGRVRRELRDDALVSRPVAAVQLTPGGDVYVADATEARVAVFNGFGRVHRRFGDGVLQSVAAMCAGPQGLLVLDRLAQQVVVFGPDGRPLGAFGDTLLVRPRALAADAAGRVFVGDDADMRLHVFEGGERVASVGGEGGEGGEGGGPGRFGRIDALAVDGAQLYVADSLQARVQVLLIAAASLRAPGGPLT